jgi:hypothetical protein
MTLVLVLSAMGAGAQTYTVTLKAGAGTGEDVTISNNVAANVATSQSAAQKGQFWQEGDQWWFKYPNCPSTFSSPDEEKVFMGWDGATITPGTVVEINGDMTLTAYWAIEEFVVRDFDDEGHGYNLLCRVTSRSPDEVEIKGCLSIDDGCAIVIPATVENNRIPYSVTSIREEVFNSVYELTSISIPASMRSIGEKAFENCRNLATVTLHSNPTIGDGAFPDGATVTMTLPANPANGAYWTTFYNNLFKFQADENTKVYKATVSGTELTLHEVGDKIVNSGTAVILKSSVDHLVMTLTTSDGEWSDNDLWGCNERKLCSDILNDCEYTSGTIYVMGKPEGKEMGFYEYTGEYMPANKAFIALASSASAPLRGLSFVEEETTNIESVDSGQLTVDNWYTLSGVKLEGEPTEKGVYIHNGKKYIVQ